MTFRQLMARHETIPAVTSWYLADLGEARGKQELFTRQSPQRLKILREYALIESAVSSNRIEGVEIDKSRVGTIIFGKPILRDRNEEEVRGYREALKIIHESGAELALSEKTIMELHRRARGNIGDAGKFKEKNGDIIERYPDGRSRIRFKPISAAKTRAAIRELLELWSLSLEERRIHPLIALAAFNLDFLCVHPFRDGNGRVSRLLLLLQCYHLGYEVGRYISLERLVEQNKERYYETLELSSRGWHDGKHNPWHYINYVLFILKTAYGEFEKRLERSPSARGDKAKMAVSAVERASGEFSVAEICKQCPAVSIHMIRKVLKSLKADGKIKCLGRGQSARWRKTGRL